MTDQVGKAAGIDAKCEEQLTGGGKNNRPQQTEQRQSQPAPAFAER